VSEQNMQVMVRLAALKDIFRPSAPTDNLELFQGRFKQLEGVNSGIQEIGQHVVVFGERGVGKTSIAYIARGIFLSVPGELAITVRVQCAEGDSFDAVWKRFGNRLQEEAAESLSERDFAEVTETLRRAESILLFSENELSPDDVRRALKIVAARIKLLVIVDEFDRTASSTVSTFFADLIKTLSDDLVKMTLLFVGVAENVTDLIDGHESTIRNIRQVSMPRMSNEELERIVVNGYEQYRLRSADGLTCDIRAARSIARISQGFPYYTHLLAGAAGAEAIRRGLDRVTTQIVVEAMIAAVDGTSHAIKTSYLDAVEARADAQLENTLLACALAEIDYMGYFTSSSLNAPISHMSGEQKGPGHFARHLKRFALVNGANSILEEKRTGERKVKYRFRDPLMKPFVLIKGVQSGLYKIGQD